jgi:hypothetical protein
VTAARSTPPPRRDDEATSIGGVIDLVKAYAQQETIGPLKGAGRWLAMGAAGAALLGVGLSYVLLGLLRLIQTEWDWAASGSWSWLAYLLVFVVCVLLIVLTVSRINKDRLNKEPK